MVRIGGNALLELELADMLWHMQGKRNIADWTSLGPVFCAVVETGVVLRGKRGEMWGQNVIQGTRRGLHWRGAWQNGIWR
jgi:hypothetical protein